MKDIWIIIIIFLLSIIIGLVFRALLNYQEKEELKKEKKKELKKDSTFDSSILESESNIKNLLDNFEKDPTSNIPIGWNDKEKIVNLSLDSNLLVIGTTGGGKSICFNEIITSIIMNYSKEEIKILTIDTSMVELSTFNNIPHYIKNTIISPLEIMEELEKLEKEIERREKNSNNTKIVVLIDDLYDVCSYDSKVLPTIERLLKNSKSKNICFIIATDTPSEEIITEKLKNEIDGTIYLTLSPGEKKAFSLDLTKQDNEYITEIGNAIYKTKEKKEKIKIPEVSEEEIKIIKDYFL